MTIRPFAELEVDFPDDTVEEDGDIVVFPGRNIADTLASILRKFGYEVSTPEHQHEHGWDFEVTFDLNRIWFQVQGGDTNFILSSEYFYNRNFFKVRNTPYAEVLTRLNEGMRKDQRFQKISWWLDCDFRTGLGATEPVDE